jgi:hypothetical protein
MPVTILTTVCHLIQFLGIELISRRHTPFIYDSISYHPIYVWLYQACVFPSGFSTKIVYVYIRVPCVLHALPISTSSVEKGTNNEAYC